MTDSYRPAGQKIDHEERRKSIGGSEIASIFGLNKFQSANQLWELKVGLAEPFEGNELTRAGLFIEPAIIEMYKDSTGYRVESSGVARHKLYPWATCSPDGIVFAGDKKALGLEAKNVSAYMSHEWGEPPHGKVPDAYLLQCHWCMMITEMDLWHLACLINGNDFRVYHIPRDTTIEATMLARARTFWFEHVIRGIPPEEHAPDKVVDRYLQRKYGKHDDDIIAGGEEVETIVENYRVAKKKHEEYQLEMQVSVNMLKDLIGSHKGIQGDTFRATWTENKNGTRVFRLKDFID